MQLSVTQAFEYFVRTAQSVGAAVAIDPPEVGGIRIARIIHNGAQTRLTWHALSTRLVLEVTQGPPKAPPVGWFEIVDVGAIGELLLEPAEPDIDFQSSVAYALELMGFSYGDPPA